MNFFSNIIGFSKRLGQNFKLKICSAFMNSVALKYACSESHKMFKRRSCPYYSEISYKFVLHLAAKQFKKRSPLSFVRRRRPAPKTFNTLTSCGYNKMPNKICDLVLSEDVDLTAIGSLAHEQKPIAVNTISTPLNTIASVSSSRLVSDPVPKLTTGMPIETAIAINTTNSGIPSIFSNARFPLSAGVQNLSIRSNPSVSTSSLPIHFHPNAGTSASIAL